MLKHFIEKGFEFTEDDLFKIGYDILKALSKLKDSHIIHGDLSLFMIAKGENEDFLLLDKFDDRPSEIIMKEKIQN